MAPSRGAWETPREQQAVWQAGLGGVVTQRDAGCPIACSFLELWEAKVGVSRGVCRGMGRRRGWDREAVADEVTLSNLGFLHRLLAYLALAPHPQLLGAGAT